MTLDYPFTPLKYPWRSSSSISPALEGVMLYQKLCRLGVWCGVGRAHVQPDTFRVVRRRPPHGQLRFFFALLPASYPRRRSGGRLGPVGAPRGRARAREGASHA